jgi:hypothetical protein
MKLHEPTFAVVFAIGPGDSEFCIKGIFSREEDAACLAASLNADPNYIDSACVDRLTMDQIAEEVAEAKLKPLGDKLFELLKPML